MRREVLGGVVGGVLVGGKVGRGVVGGLWMVRAVHQEYEGKAGEES